MSKFTQNLMKPKVNEDAFCSSVGFGRATQYPSTCQKICYGAQCIYGIP
jgi:hypothetical protein